jgi:hypothetical protein
MCFGRPLLIPLWNIKRGITFSLPVGVASTGLGNEGDLLIAGLQDRGGISPLDSSDHTSLLLSGGDLTFTWASSNTTLQEGGGAAHYPPVETEVLASRVISTDTTRHRTMVSYSSRSESPNSPVTPPSREVDTLLSCWRWKLRLPLNHLAFQGEVWVTSIVWKSTFLLRSSFSGLFLKEEGFSLDCFFCSVHIGI